MPLTKRQKVGVGFGIGGLITAIVAATRAKAAPPVGVDVGLTWHSDPEFDPDSMHTAVCSVSNPTGATWNYAVRLLVGDFYDQSQNIVLSAGDSGPLDYPVTMPSIEGIYPVSVEVSDADTGTHIRTFPFEAVDVKVAYVPPSTAWGYDFNGNGYIDSAEEQQALDDYNSGLIPADLYQMVRALYRHHVRYGQLKGDFNDDGIVDHSDFEAFGACYGTSLGDNAYNPIGDFDDDGDIDIYDFTLFSAAYEAEVGVSLTWR